MGIQVRYTRHAYICSSLTIISSQCSVLVILIQEIFPKEKGSIN